VGPLGASSGMLRLVAEDQDWARLAKLVVSARVARGMNNREQLAKEGGFSTRFLGDIETGRRSNYDPAYLARLEQALGWETGSVDVILAGGEPIRPTPDANGEGGDDDFADLELEVRMILAWDLPPHVKTQVLAEALRLREQQARATRRLREQQAQERRRLVSRWMDQAGGAQPAEG
jgi:transcriptional regulator with XRE-family HTH domain